MEENISSRDIFAIYEKEFPTVEVEEVKEESLFIPDGVKEEVKEEVKVEAIKETPTFTLPAGFEEGLIEKISAKILEGLKKGESNE